MTDSWSDDPGERDPLPPVAPVQLHPPSPEQLADAHARREQLRAEELQRLTDLARRVEGAIAGGAIEIDYGVKLLLDISKTRCALGGVGFYPGAF